MSTTDDQLAQLLTRNSALFATYDGWSSAQTKLLAGTIDDSASFNSTGGKTGALGYYPVVNTSGTTIYVPCLARLQAIAAGATDPTTLNNLLSAQVTAAANSATAAATSAASTNSIITTVTDDPVLRVVDDLGNVSLTLGSDGKTLKAAGTTLQMSGTSVFVGRQDGAANIEFTNTGDIKANGLAFSNIQSTTYSTAITDALGYIAMGILNDGSGLDAGALRLQRALDGLGTLGTPGGKTLLKERFGGDGITIGGVDIYVDTGTSYTGLIVVDSLGFIGAGINASGQTLSSASASTSFSAAEKLSYNAIALGSSSVASRKLRYDIPFPTTDYIHVVGYGQSLEVGYLAVPVKSRVAKNNGAFMLGSSPRSGPGAQFSQFIPAGSATLQPLVAVNQDASLNIIDDATAMSMDINDTRGEPPGVAATNFFRTLWNRKRNVVDDPAHKVIYNSCAFGGTTAEQQSYVPSDGNNRFGRMVDLVNRTSAVVTGMGKTYSVGALLYLAGEANYQGVNGTSDSAGYQVVLNQLFNDFDTYVASITNSKTPTPKFIYQTTQVWTNDLISIGHAQLALADARPDLTMFAPSYPVVDNGGHLTANGSAWLGMYAGKVMSKVIDNGQDWQPLRMQTPVWRGREILVPMLVPAPPIVFDMPWMLKAQVDYTDKGFAVYDNGVRQNISSVTIAGDALIRIVTTSNLVGPVEVSYAGLTTFVGQGCLRDSDDTLSSEIYTYDASIFQHSDENIPSLVNKPFPLFNWMVADRLTAISV